jgi:hypothetical protein
MVSIIGSRFPEQRDRTAVRDLGARSRRYRARTGLPIRRWRGKLAISLLIPRILLVGADARADALQDYARQCDDAIGVTVPDFDCDAGTEVPGQGSVFNGNATCDQPNRLNRQCDPGSRFQVLTRSESAYVVAHCRKENGETGKYGDIAVIQYSRIRGATCFYQALGNQSHGNLSGGSQDPTVPMGEMPVKAPSKGQSAGPPWLSPSGTASIGCGGCHDNGPLIRSPYLNQVTGPNALPGSDDISFNSNQPYAFVGQDFASWKAYKVVVSGNQCISCHRLGVNNVRSGLGTALDFAIRATAASEVSKNPTSPASPIWMPPFPVQVTFNQAHANSAKVIHDCAQRLGESPLPNSPECCITQFAGSFSGNMQTQIAVPNVVGLNRPQAETQLEAIGLRHIARFPFSATGNGSAAAQNPPSGTMVTQYSIVDISYPSVLGDGIPPVEGPPLWWLQVAVPKIIGLGRPQAETELEKNGLRHIARFPFSATGDGSAMLQSPPAGTMVTPHSIVDVSYPSVLGDGIPPVEGPPLACQ